VGFVNNVVILIVAVVVIIAVVAVLIRATQQRRSTELRRRFGPEYERTVEASHDKRAAEKELRERQERVDALDIRPLEPAARDRYGERWREIQAMFVDDPNGAVEQADTLIGEVMRARGYPVGDFEQRAADISVNHPQVVDHYRTAHSIAVRNRSDAGATEQLRQAFVHYRALFAELLETPDTESTRRAAAPGVAPAPGKPAPAEPAAQTRPTMTSPADSTATRTEPGREPMRDPATTVDTEPADPARRAR
jgi:predicted nucleic acid-binding protein